MSDTLDHCLNLLRANDRERYLAVLFAPQDKRAALAALNAFDVETARIRDRVSEPMPGEIRLQWWREVIEGERDGEARQNPVAVALIEAIDQYHLSRTALTSLLDARVFDLYDDPLPDRAALEGYLGETVSVLFQLAAQVLADGGDPGSADAAGHGGVALGIARIVRRMALDRGRGRVMIPVDILRAAGTDPQGWLNGEDNPARQRAVSILVELGLEHLGKAEAALSSLDKSVRPVFVPLGMCRVVFGAVTSRDGAPWDRPPSLSPIMTLLRLVSYAIRR